MSSKPKIILDCDPGHDDAIAILLAAKHCNVLGITTVGGNVPLELTSRNALICTQIFESDIPVHEGTALPLINKAVHAPDIHGESGLGGPMLPDLKRSLASKEAVQFIIDTARKEDDLWLVATGPLTNVALALSQAPDIATKLKGISIMGGGTFGNRTPAAEFNIYYDPEAADIVFRSGATLLMCGLNLTHQFGIYKEELSTMQTIDNAASRFVSDMIAFFGKTYEDRYFGNFFPPLHDPCAILALSHPDIMVFEERNVSIELTGKHTRGMTVIDERGVKNNLVQNAHVGISINREKALDILLETMRAYS